MKFDLRGMHRVRIIILIWYLQDNILKTLHTAGTGYCGGKQSSGWWWMDGLWHTVWHLILEKSKSAIHIQWQYQISTHRLPIFSYQRWQLTVRHKVINIIFAFSFRKMAISISESYNWVDDEQLFFSFRICKAKKVQVNQWVKLIKL